MNKSRCNSGALKFKFYQKVKTNYRSQKSSVFFSIMFFFFLNGYPNTEVLLWICLSKPTKPSASKNKTETPPETGYGPVKADVEGPSISAVHVDTAWSGSGLGRPRCRLGASNTPARGHRAQAGAGEPGADLTGCQPWKRVSHRMTCSWSWRRPFPWSSGRSTWDTFC